MADEEQVGNKKSKASILPILFFVINLLVMGGSMFLIYSATLGHGVQAVTEEMLNKELEDFRKNLQEESVIYQMETFNANLAGVPRRLIRMDLSFEMLDEEGFEEIIGLEAEARDAIIRIVNNQIYDEIRSVQGKLKLKNSIVSKVNALLDNGVVKNIYFTDFVIQ